MKNRITGLYDKLIQTDDPEEFEPAAAQLRREIRDCVERIRDNVIGVVLIDRIVHPPEGTSKRLKENHY